MVRYQEVADDLRTRVHTGEYAIGSNLPNYAELTASYQVGRGVVSAALGVLEREGLIRVVKRAGIRVLDWRIERRRITRGRTVMRDPRRGYIFPAASRPDEPWDTHGRPTRSYEPVPDRIAAFLGIESGIAVLRRRRITSPAGEPPFQIVDTWLAPQAVRDAPQVAEADTGPGGYIDRLEDAGHGPLQWTEYTRTTMPSREAAALLQISPEAAVLELMLVARSPTIGRPIDVTVRLIPADRVELVTELQRGDTARWPVTPIAPDRPPS